MHVQHPSASRFGVSDSKQVVPQPTTVSIPVSVHVEYSIPPHIFWITQVSCSSFQESDLAS
jgi:hypothetical protein